MTFTSNFKVGVDVPPWHWLQQLPLTVDPGSALTTDGTRYLYFAVQSSQATGGATAGTTQLWAFDTWSAGWGLLATLTSGNQGISIEYDPNRNVIYVVIGATLTAWQCFNLNTTSVTIAGTACAARVATTVTPVLPAGAGVGASIAMPSWGNINTSIWADPQPVQPAASGGSSTNVKSQNNIFTPMHVGMQIQFTSGVNSGNKALITAVGGPNSVTVAPAMTGTPGNGDTFQIQLPVGTATSGAAGSLTDSAQSWPTNQYKNSDVIITSGTGSGQRRRIASNTGTALTLAGAVTGNANTGNWSVNPDNTSVYQIQPSGDFLYYASAGATATVWSLDVSSTAPPSWVATTNNTPATITGGSTLLKFGGAGAFYLATLRGGATATFYNMSLGPQVWTTPTTYFGSETFTTGSTCQQMFNHAKLFITKEGQVRSYILDLTTGILGAGPSLPYAVPSAFDGQRTTYFKSAAGVDWIYSIRAGGSQVFRVPIEWGD